MLLIALGFRNTDGRAGTGVRDERGSVDRSPSHCVQARVFHGRGGRPRRPSAAPPDAARFRSRDGRAGAGVLGERDSPSSADGRCGAL